ncbi:hypothetical protein [Loktanella sp. S4079]|uniref:hypothetical protein n=1 Tax=Loktanella sp. S4079 TaxID=579483 RepID=UPI0005FA2F29|nr:hypothetical protein [Loktanella sp. S4079]KJZ17120.1 hypothetical protein TW80_17380 [Loktanella sp. S4079]
MMPELDRQMAEIGYMREGTRMPIYWTYPHADKRLAWVVSIDLGSWGNASFTVMVAPYWIPCQHADAPFPQSVGYHATLAPNGCGRAESHIWHT